MKKQILKVLIVSDYYHPHWTGISKSVYNLTQFLKKEIDFTVLTVRFNKKLKKDEIIDGIKVIRENYLFPISRTKYSLSLIYRFSIIATKHDIILVNSPCSNIMPIALITKLFGKKLLIFHHADLILPNGLINKIVEKIYEICSIVSFFFADKISTYTKDYANHSRILKLFFSKFKPLLLPVIPLKTKTLQFRNKIYKKLCYSKNEGKILFGFAGRFAEEKGFDLLFQAIPIIVNKIPNAYFIFAGKIKIGYENSFEKNLDQYNRIKKRVTLLGLLNTRELDVFYKTINYLVVPSRSDCFNLVQAEAMLYNKPVVVSNIPGARFLVEKTGCGLLFEKENVADLANKIESITRFKAYNNFIKLKKILNNKRKLLDFFYS